MALTDDDLAFFAECLRSKDTKERIFALQRRRDVPSGDPRVLPLLEGALEDRTIAMIGRPPMFGELRVLAAQALAAERKAQGIEDPVGLGPVPQPLSSDELARLADQHGVRTHGGETGLAMRYRILRDRRLLPNTEL